MALNKENEHAVHKVEVDMQDNSLLSCRGLSLATCNWYAPPHAKPHPEGDNAESYLYGIHYEVPTAYDLKKPKSSVEQICAHETVTLSKEMRQFP